MAGGMAYYETTGGTTWHTSVTASNTTTTDATSTVWAIWADSGTADAGTSSVTWTTRVAVETDYTPTVYQPIAQPVELTPEQRQRGEEAQREGEAAVARAEELLLAHLDEAQREQYAREHSFRLIKGDKTYLIRRGRAGNVYLLDENGERAVEYCAHVVDEIPDEDNLLAQKFMLETDEDEFLRLANAHRVAA